MVRRVAGLVMLGLGLWLGWGALEAIMAFTSRGGDLASALFEPPTGIIRVISTALMSIGGLMVILSSRMGATVATVGSVFFAILGGLMAASGADSGLWMDEVIFGLAAIALSVLILTLRRA
ncbi:MAG: hypothetical protein ACX94B_13270 [Henriciella sp.]|nr:hypothetical protein [Hyphomonadaceae bacterium]